MTRLVLETQNLPMSKVLDDLDRGRRVGIPKRTHGIWDHLGLRVTGGWEAEGWRRCDLMILKNTEATNSERDAMRADYMDYIDDILDDITSPPSDDGWMSTISLDLDYQTRKLRQDRVQIRVRVDPRLLSYWEWDYNYDEVVERTGISTQQLHFAQMFTRAVVDHSILDLPTVASRYHVVVYGPAKLADLSDRWGLDPNCVTSIAAPTWPTKRPDGSLSTDPVLPALSTFRRRNVVLEQLHAIESQRPKLYLFEAGTISQWLIHRLWSLDPHASMLDLGRTLELWYPDHEWPLKSPTVAAYRRAAKSFYGPVRYAKLVASC